MNAISKVCSHWSSNQARRHGTAQLSFPGWEITPDQKEPLALDKVQAIYDCINWLFAADILTQQGRQYGMYGKKAPISMCKALALPHLAFIPSLTELARRLEEYDAYRVVCGFHGRPPTRAMLWHFQYAPLPGEKRKRQVGKTDKGRKSWFYDILYHTLIRAVLIGRQLNLDLPFHYADDTLELFETDDELQPTVLEMQEYPDLEFHLAHRKEEFFPVRVRVFEHEKPVDSYFMQPPLWWEEGTAEESYDNKIDSSRSIRQSTACSAIILSIENKILLGKRKNGYKPGYYALPGGRWRSGETLKECIQREVKEETGLEAIDLRPISISFNRYHDGHAECWSVGALITKFEGQVTLREPDRCEGWGWYSPDALPQPLFRPSKIIIDDYRLDRFPDITWDQIEDWIEKIHEDDTEPTPIAQLRLPL